MELKLFLAADYANITREGKLNVMGIFDNIYAPSFPVRHSSMHLVIKLIAELGEPGQPRDFSVKLLDEDANQVFDLSGKLQIPVGERGRVPEVNLVLALNDVIFPKPGPYAMVLFIDKDHKGELKLNAKQLEAPPPAGNKLP
jgi:hypothetical protein